MSNRPNKRQIESDVVIETSGPEVPSQLDKSSTKFSRDAFDTVEPLGLDKSSPKGLPLDGDRADDLMDASTPKLTGDRFENLLDESSPTGLALDEIRDTPDAFEEIKVTIFDEAPDAFEKIEWTVADELPDAFEDATFDPMPEIDLIEPPESVLTNNENVTDFASSDSDPFDDVFDG